MAEEAEINDEIVTETEVEEAEAETTEEISEEQAEQEEKPSESSTEKPDKKEKVKDSMQERMDELTRLRRETEKDRDYWREIAKSKNQESKPLELGKTLQDFDYDEKAFTEYALELAESKARERVETETRQEKLIRKQAEFNHRESEFAQKTEDYMSKIRDPSVLFTKEMVELAQDTELGPEILYHLANNKDLVNDKLRYLDERSLAREIGKIEAKLSTPVEKQSVSKAPPPAPKIDAVSASVNIKASSADSDKLSTEAWLKKRNKEILARR